MKKKFISILLTIMMIVTNIPMPIQAATNDSPTLEVESVYAQPGEIIDLNVNIKNNPGMYALNIVLSWDKNLEIVSCENGIALGNLTLQLPKPLSNGRFTWDGQDPSEKVDGTILKVKFKVSEKAKENSNYLVDIKCDPNKQYDSNRNHVDFTINKGYVKMLTYIPGDVNGDKIIDSLDVRLLRQYISDGCETVPEGYNVTLNELAGDVDASGFIDSWDVISIRQYISDGCLTVPEGYNITLLPGKPKCIHELEAIPEKKVTCTEDGNIAYWHCSKCDKYFDSSDAKHEIYLEDTIIKHKGHVEVIDPYVAPTEHSVGYTEGSHCSVCGKTIKPQEEIPMLQLSQHNIRYNLSGNDAYLEKLVNNGTLVNPNPETYYSEKGLKLKPLVLKGYTFKGWYNGYGDEVREIPIGSNEDIILFAKWEVSDQYTIAFVNEDTNPIEVKIDGKMVTSITKKFNESLILPEPEMQGYVFLCWTDAEGHVVKNINPGSYGHKSVKANWTSIRNQTVPVKKLDKPIIYEDNENGQILFIYEIGKIINVPLQEIKSFGNVIGDGLTWTKETSMQISVNQSRAQEVANTISQATQLSSSWTLSDEWTKDFTCDIEHQEGVTREDAQKITDSVANGEQWNVSSQHGGSTAFVKNSGSSHEHTTEETSGKVSGWSNTFKNEFANSNHGEFELGADVSLNASLGILSSPKLKGKKKENSTGLGASISGHAGASQGWETSSGHSDEENSYEDETTGTKDVKVDNSYSNKSSSSSSTWNSSKSYTSSKNVMNQKEVSQNISKMINDTYGYSSSSGHNTQNSQTTGKQEQQTKEREYSTSVEYSTEKSEIVTTTITNEGAAKGWYRLVSAGTVHVFGVVGYDIANNTYYTSSYNVIDEKERYEFFDYSLDDALFKDRENGVLPFEIPVEVNNIINDIIQTSSGLTIDPETGIVTRYSGLEDIVIIPDYISIDNGNGTRSSVMVKGISSNVFRDNKTVKVVKLGRFIKQIPNDAFSGCTNLEVVAGLGLRDIGDNAFADCTSLRQFTISKNIKNMGINAFKNVNDIVVKAANTKVAEATFKSGAKHVSLWLGNMSDSFTANNTNKVLTIPDGTEYFSINGERKTTIESVEIISHAKQTDINGLTIKNNKGTPLKLYSNKIDLAWVDVQSNGIGLIIDNPDAIVRLRATSSVNSKDQIAILSRSTTYKVSDFSIASKLNVSGDMVVCGKFNQDEPNLVRFTNGSLKQCTDAEFENLQKLHTITFDANGGSVNQASKTIRYGQTYGELPLPTRSYYKFDGWFTSASGGSKVTSNTVFTSANNQTLYAHWTRNVVTVTFDANGGSIDTSSRNVNCGETYGSLPTPARDYYVFDGWYTDKNGGTKVTSSTSVTALENHILYAHWIQKGVSDWTLKSNMPSGAQIIDTKWTYDEKTFTESGSYSLSGWIKYDTRRTGWGSTQGPLNWDPNNGERNVWSEQYETGRTHHWVYYRYRNPSNNYGSDVQSGSYSQYEEIDLTYALTEPGSNGNRGRGYKYWQNGKYTTYWPLKEYDDISYGTRWYYQEPVYTYYYYKYVSKESGNRPSGNNISNVKEWVRYRAK